MHIEGTWRIGLSKSGRHYIRMYKKISRVCVQRLVILLLISLKAMLTTREALTHIGAWVDGPVIS